MSMETTPNAGATPHHHLSDSEWQAIERDPEFQELLRQKRQFIIPSTILFVVAYFAFLILVGYVPSFANINIIGKINVAYLLALLQFAIVWGLMALYVRRARDFDREAAKIDARVEQKVRGGAS